MAMSNFERDVGFTEVALSPLRRPRFIVSRRGTVLLLALCYVVLVALAALLFAVLEQVQSYDDHRNVQVTQIFAVVAAIPFGWTLARVLRRVELPHQPR